MKEQARFWRHPALPRVDLLHARYVTHRYTRHTHEEFAIGVIVGGVEEFACRGSTYRAGTGQLVVVSPEYEHTGHAGVPEGWAYRMMYPPAETISERGTPYFADPVIEDPALARLLLSTHAAAEHGDDLAASTLMRTFAAELVSRHASPGPPREAPAGSQEVRQAVELLHERLVEPPSLEGLAEAVRSAPFPLLRAFKAATGLPPHAYLTTLRVREARRLLAAGMPAARVATEVGFTDQAHLTRHFKRIVGVPPAAYQRAAGTYKTH